MVYGLHDRVHQVHATGSKVSPYSNTPSTYKRLFLRSAIMLAVLVLGGTVLTAWGILSTKPHKLSPTLTASDQKTQPTATVPATTPQQQGDAAQTSTPASGSGTATTSSTSSTNVQVNGIAVAVPENGSTQQTVHNGDGTTSISVDHTTSSTAGQNDSSLNLNVSSESSGG
jgi:hypothetical protein